MSSTLSSVCICISSDKMKLKNIYFCTCNPKTQKYGEHSMEKCHLIIDYMKGKMKKKMQRQ